MIVLLLASVAPCIQDHLRNELGAVGVHALVSTVVPAARSSTNREHLRLLQREVVGLLVGVLWEPTCLLISVGVRPSIVRRGGVTGNSATSCSVGHTVL